MSEKPSDRISDGAFELPPHPDPRPELKDVVSRLAQSIERDDLVQNVVHGLRLSLEIDRVVLYYFYRRWKGQVTFEALSHPSYSIFGITGADDCFNDEYAALYEDGRYRAIKDIESEPIHDCHRDFLRSIQVKSNLVVPVLISQGLWGLLAAHHCQGIRPWTDADITTMQAGANRLATSATIKDAALN
ncbi:Phytochrome-like protein cph2 [Acaryochloris thomasi RCC1774]|uniref:Phytochrome-like protein cph2 n=1 Tax=Acaryochloris thomasi RCC1774 TaxID=1764569 RepID=A0A2W1K4T4_9CYAN|nr:GAF domain-containing protein [Acaryochloris thomasi]PZD74797.1 Phytochrome-like protein cph2 [Acaryochloris thomasi RCC1774]